MSVTAPLEFIGQPFRIPPPPFHALSRPASQGLAQPPRDAPWFGSAPRFPLLSGSRSDGRLPVSGRGSGSRQERCRKRFPTAPCGAPACRRSGAALAGWQTVGKLCRSTSCSEAVACAHGDSSVSARRCGGDFEWSQAKSTTRFASRPNLRSYTIVSRIGREISAALLNGSTPDRASSMRMPDNARDSTARTSGSEPTELRTPFNGKQPRTQSPSASDVVII